MKTKDKRILVLTDLRKTASATLNNTLGIAKKIDAKVELFHVKNPLDVIRSENQLIAMRSIGKFQTKTHDLFDNLLSTTNYDEIDVNYSFTVGRLKKEISRKIDEYKPDLIVVGKRSSNPLKLSGDKLTNYIIKRTSCPVLIASSKKRLNEDLSLVPAFYNNSSALYSNFMDMIDMPKNLESVQNFRIISKEDSRLRAKEPNKIKSNEYLFDHNDNVINTMSKYLSKSNVNLFFIEWENQLSNDLKSLIRTVDVPLLVAPKNRGFA